MVFQKATFVRLFPSAPSGSGLMSYTSFGFESHGKRFFDVTVPGRPRIVEGMTVVALLKARDGFSGNGLVGWVDSHDGSIACDSASKHFGVFLLCAFLATMFPLGAYALIASEASADIAALTTAALFGGFACRFLYLSAKAFLVTRAFATVRDSIKSAAQRD